MLRPPGLVLDALGRLIEAGYEASIVGGALRDTLLMKPIPDWDIATSAACDRIRQLFSDRKIYQLKHKTVTIVLPGSRLEITPYRDPEGTLEGDLARRDFTINSMAYDLPGQRLIDPWGGRKDLAKRMLRATGDPDLRFREDPVRLLRGVRLATELDFEIDPQTLQSMETLARLLSRVARERVREELIKLLMCSHPSRGFRILSEHRMLKQIIPELCEGVSLEQNAHHQHTVFAHALETMERLPQVLHLRLAGLLHDIAKPSVRTFEGDTWRFLGHARESAYLAEKIMSRLRFSRPLTEKVAHLIAYHMIEYTSQWSDGAVRRLVGKAGKDSIDDLLALRKADLLAHGTGRPTDSFEELQKRVRSTLQKKQATSVHQLATNGHAVMELLHLKPGPRVGDILQHLLEIVTENPHLNNPDDLKSLLERDFLP